VVILYFSIKRFFSRPKIVQSVPAAAPAQISPAEQENNWCQRRGWKTNPFDANIFQQLFIGDRKLELDSLKSFIRARIESVGGCAIDPFTEPAIYEIFRISRGNPKSALQICEWAVDKTIERGQDLITAELIKGYEEIKPASILIAEDEEMVRSTLDGILRLGGGYVTDMASDGQEALKKIKNNTYDLVLLDISMPKIDGYEVLKQARALHPRMPMVFISGKASPEKIMESLSAHDLTAFIEKPFAMERVLDVVARALKLR
jgi:CheY-like chemotaxis protein